MTFRSRVSPRPPGVVSVPLSTTRWRWSLSERERSAPMSWAFWGWKKKKFPAVSRALEKVYERRALPQDTGRCASDTVMPLYQESPMDWYCWLLAYRGSGRPRFGTVGSVVVGT